MRTNIFPNEMLLMLQIRHPIVGAAQGENFPGDFSFVSLENVTQVTAEWKVNKIKGKAFRQDEQEGAKQEKAIKIFSWITWKGAFLSLPDFTVEVSLRFDLRSLINLSLLNGMKFFS